MFWASLCPKHVEIILITNKSLFVASSWSLLYLLIKDARSFEHKVYQPDCLKVNVSGIGWNLCCHWIKNGTQWL